MFMRIFLDEVKGVEFMQLVKGILTIRYDWDDMRNQMVKEFVVKYW